MFLLSVIVSYFALAWAGDYTIDVAIACFDSKIIFKEGCINVPSQLTGTYTLTEYVSSSVQAFGCVGVSSKDIDVILSSIETRSSFDKNNGDKYDFPRHFLTPSLNTPTVYRFDTKYNELSNAALIFHVRMAVYNARVGLSKLTHHQHGSYVLHNVTGMSSVAGRHLMNNICSAMGTRYLEVGTWHGSTLMASLVGNENNIESVAAIDWWAWDDPLAVTQTVNPIPNDIDWHKSVFGPSELAYQATFESVMNYTSMGSKVNLIRSDCFKVNTEDLLAKADGNKFNVYLYDAEHGAVDQYMAFTYFDSVLSDVFVAVIDDWNFPSVPEGTSQAFADLGYTVLYGEVLGGGRENNDDLHPWHNGMYVAVVEKKRTG